MSPLTEPADPTKAVAAYLRSTIGDLVEDRVFRPELPRKQIASMPRACIVLRLAGGYTLTGGGSLPVGDPRIDAICYGSTRMEAQKIATATLLALHDLERQVFENTLLHWARIGGAVPGVDPDAHWPLFLVSAQVAFAMRTVV